jgi:hypothetical protein
MEMTRTSEVSVSICLKFLRFESTLLRTQAVRNLSVAHGHDYTNIRFWEVSLQTVHLLFPFTRNVSWTVLSVQPDDIQNPGPKSAGGGGGEGVINYRDRAFQKGTWGPNILHVFSSFSVASLLVDCTNEPFQTKLRSFQFSVNILSRTALVGGRGGDGVGVGAIDFFLPGFETALSGPAWLLTMTLYARYLTRATEKQYSIRPTDYKTAWPCLLIS